MKQLTDKSKFIRTLWWSGIFGAFILLSAIAIGFSITRMDHIPTPDNSITFIPSADNPITPTPGLDFSTTRLSDNGLFRVTYVSSENIVPVNQMHQ